VIEGSSSPRPYNVSPEGGKMAKSTAEKTPRPVARVGDTGLVERRRAQIVEAATRLVARQGFAKTVVRDIAEEASISVGLVYEYVRSKEDILFLIYEHWTRVWGEGLEGAIISGKGPLEQLDAATTFLVKMADRHADVTHLFYRETGHLSEQGLAFAKAAERSKVERVAGVIDEAVGKGLFRPETDSLLVATNLVMLAHTWVLKGYLLRKGRTAVGYAGSVVDTVVRGWATPAGRRAWDRRRS
jgi:AcrR family transcriptional regulator